MLAGMVNIDTPWFSNTGAASWPLRIGLVAVGVILCLVVMPIKRRKTTAQDDNQHST